MKSQKTKSRKLITFMGVIILLMAVVEIYRTYAIYSLEKKYDKIQNKTKEYLNSGTQIAVLVDGQESNTFPSAQDNYYVESVECTNGVEASFDIENWQISIADMGATSTNCVVSFDSHRTNSVMPNNMTKEDLIDLNEEIADTVPADFIDKMYPVGSVYISVTEDTVAKVEAKFGGTWEKYSEGTFLMGANSTYAVDSTGGNSTVTLGVGNIPNHVHTYTPAGTNKYTTSNLTSTAANQSKSISASFSGTSASTESAGSHNHGIRNAASLSDSNSSSTSVGYTQVNRVYYAVWTSNTTGDAGAHQHYYTPKGSVTISNTAHTHSVTAAALSTAVGTIKFTGSAGNTTACTNCSATPVDILNPYTAAYMYKRVS